MATPTSVGSVTTLTVGDLSGLNYVDSLSSSVKWGGVLGATASLTYSFGGASSVYRTGYGAGEPLSGFSEFSATQKTATVNALSGWADVANVTFTEVTDSATVAGDLRFAISDVVAPTSSAYLPAATAEAGDVWFSNDAAYNTANPGTLGYFSFMQEIGHALGLKLPHATDGTGVVADLATDCTLYTLMSTKTYVGDADAAYTQDFFSTTPMLYDVAAIQYLYGANMTTRTGDTTYSWTPGQQIFETIWDAGGTDTIDWSNQTTDAVIDLNAGAYSQLGPGYYNGQTTETKTLGIAYGATIENARGGSGNDTITGNSSANYLYGHDGNDTMYGGDGDDRIDGGSGDDTTYGGDGNDYVDANSGNDIVHGGAGNDYVDASSGNDTVYGDAGNDVIDGSWGDDRVYGGAGNDRLDGSWGNDIVYGDAGDDIIDGSWGDDSVYGGDGNDTLEGSWGNDLVYGEAGDDTFVATWGTNTFDGGVGVDTINYDVSFNVDVDLAAGVAATPQDTSINDTLVNIENVTTWGGDNVIVGNAQDNILISGGGADTLNGGAGADTLNGGDGSDTVSYVNAANGVAVLLNIGGAVGAHLGEANGDTFIDIENITGSSHSDYLVGDAVGNIITAGAGNDALIGNDGNDTLEGGLGADYINGGSGSDTASYANAASGVAVLLNTGGAVGAHLGEASGDTFISIENITGSAYSDYLVGDGVDNVINAGTGNDALLGNDGNDTLIGGLGADYMNGGSGSDTISYANAANGVAVLLNTGGAVGAHLGEANGDTFVGIENITGSAHSDYLVGDTAANVITAGVGNDALIGNDGNDTLNGDAGDDMLQGGRGADVLNGGAGTDTVSYANAAGGVAVLLNLGGAVGAHLGEADGDTFVGVENITGSAHSDYLVGDAVGNVINAGVGIDALIGNAGNDTLFGGAGADYLSGGTDSDIFRYTATGDSTAASRDTIADFDATDNAEDIFLDGLLSGVFSWLGAGAFTGGSNTEATFNDATDLLQIDTNGDATADIEITLTGVALGDLDALDFTVT